MSNTMTGSVEAAENMGPKIKGIINNIRKGSQPSENFGYITVEGGRTHFFSPFSLASFNPNIDGNKQITALMEEFSNLSEKSKVIFNSTDKRGAFAMNLALDTSEETSILIPKTEFAVDSVLNMEILTSSPECSMEDGTFRIDSSSWNTIELVSADGSKVSAKVSPEGDVWELQNGEQFFTPASMLRETTKAGRKGDAMNAEQAEWLLKNTPNNIPEGCTFAGFIDDKGQIHFSGAQSCYWVGESEKSGMNKALFCINVDEDMKPYMDEMVIGELGTKSALQVRLLKPKTK